MTGLTTKSVMEMGPVMPVIVIEDATQAVPLADALLAGGIKVAEITLRSDAALEAVKRIADSRPEICVGVGTILSAEQAKQAAQAGAMFGVSPGATDHVLSGAEDAGLPLLPGAATVSEMMALTEKGYTELKFFPASSSGGLPFLKSLVSPLPHLSFCPTGGISLETAPEWLKCQNILCVGGSWIAPKDAISDGAFDLITNNAKTASQLGR